MEYLYPKFNKTTHTIKELGSISLEYPINNSFMSRKDYEIPLNSEVCVIEENVGYGCKWSKVRLLNPQLQVSDFFILKEKLENIGNKKTFEAVCTPTNMPALTDPDIDPRLKEIFLPYVDTKNGLFSVRIQTDYDKILDSYTLDQLLHDVYYEGVSLLLSSRGFRSDNATITNLINSYYTFAYINKDLDLTVERVCEPLTFTVSIPLRFFNSFVAADTSAPIFSGNKILTFNNKDIIYKTNKLLKFISSKAGDFQELTFPDKFIEGFTIDFEIASLQTFVSSANQLFTISGFPFKDKKIVEYYIGLKDNLDISSIKVIVDGKETILATNLVSQFKLNASFNSKRIFNYFLNLQNIENEILNIDAITFLNKYVDYPKAKLNSQQIVLPEGITLPPDTVRRYRTRNEASKNNTIRLADVGAAATETIQLSDTIYSLFIENQNKKTLETGFGAFKKNFGILDGGSFFGNVDLQGLQDESIGLQFKDGATVAFDGLKQKYSSLNTYQYILSRLNIKKILFQHILCYIKGINPNGPLAEEIADLISQLPEEVINYFNYLSSIKSLKGAEYAKAVANGLPLDSFSLSSKNESLAYFVKGLTKVTKNLNVVGANVARIQNSLATTKRAKNPYKAVVEQTILGIEQLLLSTLLDITREALAISCENDLLADNNNYENPYKTHRPVSTFQYPVNSKQEPIKNNRKNAIDEVYNNVEFGFDREYVIDLLDYLFTDINCILTPIESVNLLRGRPTELVITLVRNIIKNKYSKPPNDLSFMLTDNNKLLLFFQKLGLTVDQDVLSNIEKTITESNKISKTDICNPQYEKIREEILNQKIPPELGVLESQLRNRVKKARKLFDYIQSGVDVIEISPLCPDNPSKEISDVKQRLVDGYAKLINDLFTPALESFNSDVVGLQDKISQKGKYFRKTSDGKLIDSVEYDTYYADLAASLSDDRALSSDQKLAINPITNTITSSNIGISYSLPSVRDQALQATEYSFTFTAPQEIIYCSPTQEEKNNIEDFFKQGNKIYVESVLMDQFFDGGDTSAGGDYGDTLKRSRNKIDEIAKELVKQDYFFAITINEEIEGNDYNIFNFYYNNKIDNKYERKNIEIREFKNVIEEKTQTSWELTKNAFGTRLIDISIKSNDLVKPILYRGINSKGFEFGSAFIIYSIDYAAWLKFDPVVQIIIIDVFNQFILPNIKKAQERKKTVDRLNSLTQNGFFNQYLYANFQNNTFQNQIDFLSSIDERGEAKYKNYVITNEFSDFNLAETYKSLDNSRVFSNMIYKASQIALQFSEDSDARKNMNASLILERFISEPNYLSPNEYLQQLVYLLRSSMAASIKDNKYFKQNYDYLQDFIYYSDDSKVPFTVSSEESAKEFFSNGNTRIVKNNSPNSYQNLYAKYTLFKIEQNAKQKACNVLNHYLNLDFYKNSALNELGDKICETNLDDGPDAAIKEILVNLTIRTYVADILIKVIPFLSLLERDEMVDLFKNKSIVDMLLQIILVDQKDIAPQVITKNEQEVNRYNYVFKKYVDEVYDSYINNGIVYGLGEQGKEGRSRIIKKFNDNLDCKNDEYYKFKYFIKKEIYYFINYCLQKSIIQPSAVSFWRAFCEDKNTKYQDLYQDQTTESRFMFPSSGFAFLNFRREQVEELSRYGLKYKLYEIEDFEKTFKDKQSISYIYEVFRRSKYRQGLLASKKINANFFLFIDENVKKYIKELFFSQFAFFVASNNVDVFKRSMFFSTKYELYNALAQSNASAASIGKETEFPTDEDISTDQTKLTKFIDNLSKSPAPYALAILNPRYMKHVLFFLKATNDATRNIIGTMAKNSDFNISLASKINELLSVISITTWSLFDEETRRRLVYESSDLKSAVLLKRLDDGKTIVPYSLTLSSLGVWFGSSIAPTKLGWTYLALDSLEETLYTYDSYQQLKEAKGQEGEIKDDPCSDNVAQATQSTVTFTCSPEEKLKLIKDFNDRYESVAQTKEEMVVEKDKC